MAGFWEWRPAAAIPTTVGASAVQPVADELEPVEVYTANAMIHGQVAPNGRRLSDMLNSDYRLAIHEPVSTSVIDGVDGSAGTGWTRIDTDDILFVMPPEQLSPRALRVHKRQRRVRIHSGGYEIVGNAHLPPGVTFEQYIYRSPRFVPVTNGYAISTTEPVWERSAPVILVNLKPADDVTEIITIV